MQFPTTTIEPCPGPHTTEVVDDTTPGKPAGAKRSQRVPCGKCPWR